MKCKDFHEIADSYLSDELLVETNHEVFRHLENCEDCRTELTLRRELRLQLRSAVKDAPESQINPAFAANLRAGLRKDALEEGFFTELRREVFSLKFFAATAAVLIIALFVGLSPLSNTQQIDSANGILSKNETASGETLDSTWREISLQAVGDHEHCALEKMDYWEKVSAENSPEKIKFRENILNRVSQQFPGEIELLHVHNCLYKDRKFRHAVLRVGGRVVSVLLTETEIISDKNKTNGSFEPPITCQKQTGFQVASFAAANEAVFVISDMSEAENLSLARSLSNVMQG